MIIESTLRQVVKAQRDELEKLGSGVEREDLKGLQADLNLPFAIIISGIRRCGKSTLLRQLMSKAKNAKYFNFEDPRIAGFQAADFEKLEKVLSEEYGAGTHFFLDEIQNVEKWEAFVRQKLDAGKRFVITGSNASLLSAELGTKLTGRHLSHELLPFSYAEYLKLEGKMAGADSFGEYLVLGGFPGYLRLRRQEILQELFRDVIFRDIIARHKLRNHQVVHEIALYLLSNAGKEFSFNKLKDSYGLGATNSAVAIVSYLEDSYLLYTVPKFDYSLKKQSVNPKKAYSVDNGLSGANSASFSQDRGRMLENAVYLHLRHQSGQIFYFRQNKECDFVQRRKNRITGAYQTCYELNPDNQQREIGGLVEAMEFFKLSKGTLVTYDQEDSLSKDGKNIRVIPAWKWMLEPPPSPA